MAGGRSIRQAAERPHRRLADPAPGRRAENGSYCEGFLSAAGGQDMAASLDLDAYFDRIGWRGGTRPDFDTLAGLLRAHTSRIPFEKDRKSVV